MPFEEVQILKLITHFLGLFAKVWDVKCNVNWVFVKKKYSKSAHLSSKIYNKLCKTE